jgi:argininosuccinate synthase
VAKRVVLAYSGGLDTSVAVRWLNKERDYDVIAVAVDVGQESDFDSVKERALAAGAIEAIIIDGRAELAENFALPAMQANALYEGKYPLVSALSRPLIVGHLVASRWEHARSRQISRSWRPLASGA